MKFQIARSLKDKKRLYMTIATICMLIFCSMYLYDFSHNFPILKEGSDKDFDIMILMPIILTIIILGPFTNGIKFVQIMFWLPFVFLALIAIFNILNARLDDSASKEYEVTLFKNGSTGKGRPTCEIKGMLYPKSLHRFDCGRGRIGDMLKIKNLHEQRYFIDIKDGYFNQAWVFQIREK